MRQIDKLLRQRRPLDAQRLQELRRWATRDSEKLGQLRVGDVCWLEGRGAAHLKKRPVPMVHPALRVDHEDRLKKYFKVELQHIEWRSV